MSKTKKSIEELSAEELFALARQREEEEAERKMQEVAAERAELKARRKALVAEHRKELAALDREIQRLGGVTRRRGPRTRRATGGPTISDQLCEIVATQPEMTTTEIRVKAEEAGVQTKNLSQTLAYLKRQGRLDTPSRGVYRLAESGAEA